MTVWSPPAKPRRFADAERWRWLPVDACGNAQRSNPESIMARLIFRHSKRPSKARRPGCVRRGGRDRKDARAHRTVRPVVSEKTAPSRILPSHYREAASRSRTAGRSVRRKRSDPPGLEQAPISTIDGFCARLCENRRWTPRLILNSGCWRVGAQTNYRRACRHAGPVCREQRDRFRSLLDTWYSTG